MAAAQLENTIERWKARLLDLSQRNRLLYFRSTQTSTLELIEPDPETIFRHFINRHQAQFVIFNSQLPQTQPSIDETSDATTAFTTTRKLKPNEVRVDVEPPKLARVLFNLRQRTHTAIEEQGINILFLAAGFLNWTDPQQNLSTVTSPLLLIPVRLLRPNIGEPYIIQELEDTIELNPVLDYKLKNDFGISLPELPEDNFELHSYLDAVREAIRKQHGWSVGSRLVVSIFAFHKLAMVRDIEQQRELIMTHPITRALAGDTKALPSLPDTLPTPDTLDQIPVKQSALILDADASQQHAIAVALQGVNCVIHGPPGTGKSQTIANLIAEFLAAGKTILFVAEKRAALEVVYRRLEQRGLGEFCLDAYDIDKERVYKHLARVRKLCGQSIPSPSDTSETLEEYRRQVNEYVQALHTPIGPLNLTPYKVHSDLAVLADIPLLLANLPSPSHCTQQQRAKLDNLVDEFAIYADIIAQYDTNPWRHTRNDVDWTGKEIELRYRFENMIRNLQALSTALELVAKTLGIPSPHCLLHAQLLLQFAELHPTLRAVYDDVNARYHPLDDLDLTSLLERFRTVYTSFFRRLPLISRYSKDLDILRARYRGKEQLNYRVALHDLEKALLIKLSREFFAALDDKRSPNWDILAKVVNDITALTRNLSPREQNSDMVVDALREQYAACRQDFDTLNQLFRIDRVKINGCSPDVATLTDLVEWIRTLIKHLGELPRWQRLQQILKQCETIGLGDFVDKVRYEAQRGVPLNAEQIRRSYIKRFYHQWMQEIYPNIPILREFNDASHDQAIARFREYDRSYIIHTAQRLRSELIARLPKVELAAAPSGSELARLDHELRKQRRRMPIRKLFTTIPNVLLNLTPCVMMSPLAVAQTIDPTRIQFDVVIFDEASQLCTEDAIGAIIRSKQVIVAGDDKQLPPTAFFKSTTTDDELIDDDADPAFETYESLLEQCLVLNFPQPRLRFHYRSRDETLIAFSNYHFYNGDLVTFPAAEPRARGIRLHRVAGTYDRGGSRTNRAEATAIVELIFQHIREQPDKSLGVIALSQAQQQAILDELEQRRYQCRDYEWFFMEDRDEPFFVKNLENVQGDERDVIFLSIGYGKDANGRLTMSFGPLNAKGGVRRLNVAVTRAREQLVVVSSITAADLPVNSPNEGVTLLRRYLDFAERGISALHSTSAPTDVPAESPLEEAIARELTNRGYTVHQQVGCSGYRIDLAIVDPQRPGRYLLGIECDGAMYHSSPTARERDRIRQQILEDLGWRIIRIWSYEWIRNRDKQIARIVTALEAIQSSNSDTDPSTSIDDTTL